MDRIDLHTHTTASDGTLTPAQLVDHALELGLKAVAITDHDTVEGLPEAEERGRHIGVEVVPGTEFSTLYRGREVHIVGLLFQWEHPVFQRALGHLRQARQVRNEGMVDRLAGLGIPISMKDFRGRGITTLTRTHIGEALAAKGYGTDRWDAMTRYLSPGKPGFVEIQNMTPLECIRVIQQSGGLAFLAHLNRISKDRREALDIAEELIGGGLDGLETRYSEYDEGWNRLTEELAAAKGLLRSGGSDFHGANKPIRLGSGAGDLCVPLEYLTAMKNRLSAQNKSSPGV